MKPTRYTLMLLSAWALLGLCAAIWPSQALLVSAWRWLGGIIAVLVVADAVQILLAKPPEIERVVNHNLPINSWSKVTLRLKNTLNQPLRMELFDFYPIQFDIEGMPHTLNLEANARAELVYHILPKKRGNGVFAGTDVYLQSALNLWKRKQHVIHASEVRVYPNFAEIAKYTLMATHNRLSQFGVRKRQRRGEGQDFHQLREYRLGDSSKQINWKATARMRKLISQEYQDERDQRIVFLLDCGRRMRHEVEGLRHLDQALNAMLLLSYVGIRQGDAVGFLSFAGNDQWVAPQKGAQTVNVLLNRSYDIESSLEPPDYLFAARKFMGFHPRRCLVVLLTNTRAEDQVELKQAVQLLSLKHLVVLADLQEESLKLAIQEPVQTLEQALGFHGSFNYLDTRKQTHEQLQHNGAICLDTTAKQLPIALVNQYLDIKNSGRL